MTKPGEFHHVPVRYLSDDGDLYTFMQKKSNALAVGNEIVPYLDNPGVPERWRFRYIVVQTIYGNESYTRRLTIGYPSNPLYQGAQNTLVIDGVTWRVISRKGESRRGGRASQ